MIDALVPVKQLSAAKSRLLPGPDRAAAGRLTLAMLSDVLSALAGAQRIGRRAVVTPDEAVARHAEAAGARAIRWREPGLNPALDHAAAALGQPGQGGLLVILGDVAGALSPDLDRACAAAEELGHPGVVLCPASDGGTAALLRSPPDAIPARFGAESAARHRAEAATAGVALHELALPSLRIDLDRAEDVRAFLATAGGGARTRRVLAELGWDS